MNLSFFVPGMPQGKGRPRAARRGDHITLYTPKKTASYEALVALTARHAMAGRPLIEGPVVLCMEVAFGVPQSWSKKAKAQALADIAPPTKKPDADNVLKSVCDAINGVVWVDDTQVVEVILRKTYRATPGVHIEIESYTPPTTTTERRY